MNRKANILVVDDTSENLVLLCSILKEEGYNTFPADSGELALSSLENNIPDLILLDIRMAGMNGFEVCRQIKQRENLAEIPIIFLSVATDIEDKLEGFRLGAVDYVTKPFQKEELLIRVKTHLDMFFLNKTLKEKMAELLK
jgi:putative two-component system response regulator